MYLYLFELIFPARNQYFPSTSTSPFSFIPSSASLTVKVSVSQTTDSRPN